MPKLSGFPALENEAKPRGGLGRGGSDNFEIQGLRVRVWGVG